MTNKYRYWRPCCCAPPQQSEGPKMGPQLPGIVNSGISAMTKPRRDTPRLLGTLKSLVRSLARTLTEKNCVVRIKIDPDGMMCTACFTAQPSETAGSDAAENTNPSACSTQSQHSRTNRDWCALHSGRHSWRSLQLPRPRQQPMQQQQQPDRRTREPHHPARRSR